MPDVLYVDDEPALLDLGKTYLELSGHLQVYTATSAREALEKMQHQDYAGIISDYQMPGMDGIEFLRLIRARHKNLPFILFTGRGREEVAIEALNSGADFYLQKGGEPTSQFVELEYKLKNAIERKRMQDELNESQQRMADIINFLPDAMFVIDQGNKVIAWNRTMEEITGIPKESILGTGDYSRAITRYGGKIPHIVDLVMNNDRTNESQASSTERKGDKITSEFHSPAVYNGRGAHLWLVASPLYDTRGSVIGAIVALRDVTERKEAEEKLNRMNEDLHAAYEQLTATEEELRQNYDELSKSEQALRRSEERYRNVVEDQTEFICRFNPDGKLTFVNDAYCRYFDLDKTACIGTKHTVVIPPEDLQRMKRHLSAFTPENTVGIIEHRIIMPSGEVRYQRWSDRAVFDTNGRIIEFQSVGRDTTDRMVAEEKLRLSHADLNTAYAQLTMNEEELRQNFDELSKSQQELRLSEERYRNVVEDQTEFICRFTPDGKLTFVNDAYCRYFGKSRKELVGALCPPEIPKEDMGIVKAHFSSITPAQPVATIEHRIRMPDGGIRWQQWSDRAVFDENGKAVEFQSVGRDITDRKRTDQALFEANKKLNLLSVITRHDILNQLTGLHGYLGLTEEIITDPDARNLIEKAMQASEVIKSQILFTRQYQDIGVRNPIWQNVYSSAMNVCQDGVFSHVSIDESLSCIEIFADPLLEMVFYNLFENAVMHGGTITRIRVTGEAAPDGFNLIIEDDGRGILPEDKQKIFGKGFGSHTGLGLFLVKEVLAITSLVIRESGEYGRGAQFRIHIPDGMFRKTREQEAR